MTNPAILLLDESTAAIDAESDVAFQHALRAFSSLRGSAVLTVAHRISTARDADRVIVMEHGRVIAIGRPAELIGAGGQFAALVEVDNARWEWKDVGVEIDNLSLVGSNRNLHTNEGGN